MFVYVFVVHIPAAVCWFYSYIMQYTFHIGAASNLLLTCENWNKIPNTHY